MAHLLIAEKRKISAPSSRNTNLFGIYVLKRTFTGDGFIIIIHSTVRQLVELKVAHRGT